VFVIAIVVLVVTLAALAIIGFSYFQGQQKYGKLTENAEMTVVESPGGEERVEATVDWDALRAINPDTVAWVYMPGTSINYPVVQGEDNEYYLTHDFEGEPGWLASYGAIFMDWRNNPDWSDAAYFFYGHHMNDGSMFASIAQLADQAYFDECRTVYLYTPDGDFTLKSFSLVHCDADDPLVQISFSSDEDKAAYLQDKIDRSVVHVDDLPSLSDMNKIFAFATCDNESVGRYVLYTYVEEANGFTEGEAQAA
jgi:sortase B